VPRRAVALGRNVSCSHCSSSRCIILRTSVRQMLPENSLTPCPSGAVLFFFFGISKVPGKNHPQAYPQVSCCGNNLHANIICQIKLTGKVSSDYLCCQWVHSQLSLRKIFVAKVSVSVKNVAPERHPSRRDNRLKFWQWVLFSK